MVKLLTAFSTQSPFFCLVPPRRVVINNIIIIIIIIYSIYRVLIPNGPKALYMIKITKS